MLVLRHFTVAVAAAGFSLAGQARSPVDQVVHHPVASASAPAAGMAWGPASARMDEHMKLMREMHEKMTQAKTPEERDALMAEHMKLMQDGMAMMGGMGPGRRGMMGGMGPGGMDGRLGKGPRAGDLTMRHDMMEKRMEMMQSMMQMMMDRMSAAPAKP